jgi:TolB-like protein/cytochrome c-type biogenesis protein CcmH/NrfG
LREIETVAGLTHPHVLPLYDSGEADELLYFVMPYVKGESLRQRLEREKQFPIDEAVQIVQEVADALDHAHREGVVHRDIKPANILLEEGHAVVTDFGVARAIRAAGGEKVTATGMAVGTPAYMSPEQASGEEVDERSDIYALGCVLYEMLAGEPPLTGASPQSTAAKRLTDRPTPLMAMRRTVPERLQSLVERTLATSAADRPATARLLVEELAEIRRGPEPAARRSLAARWLVPAIGLAVIVMAITLWRQTAISPGSADADLRSIAVLPFADMSPDKDQEYFSDGISEELLNLLAKIPELRVAARTSSFSFKSQGLAIPQIAGQLNVAHVLEGSVRKAGNEVRITVQLVRAEDGFHMWSETWHRTLDDVFSLQDEIAAEVAAQLQVTLLGVAPTVEKTDPAAYALFLQARHLARQVTPGVFERSNTMYEQALEIEPDYAAAWAGLADNFIWQTYATYELPPDEGYPLVREAANRALAIDPEFAEAYGHLGWIAMAYDGDLAAAAWHYERALELEPTNPDIIRDASSLYMRLGRIDEAIVLQEYVIARDPVYAQNLYGLGLAYFDAGRLEEAAASFHTLEALSPGLPWVQHRIGWVLLHKGEPEAALAAMQQESDEDRRLAGLAVAYHALGQAAESDAALAELVEKHGQRAVRIALVLAFRGEADRSFEWLDKAVENNDADLHWIAVAKLADNIRDDPRWLPFLESIGKSPEQLAAIEFEVTLPH